MRECNVYEIILFNKILRNHLLSEHLQYNYAPFNVIKVNRLTSIFSSNKIIKLLKIYFTLYVAIHHMSFPPLKQSLIYLMHDHEVFRDIFLALNNSEGKNILKLLAIIESNLLIPIIFGRFTFKFLKITRLLDKIKNTISLRFISLSFPCKKLFSERTCAYTGN